MLNTYNKANPAHSFLIILLVSSAKVENVVNPPHNPDFKKSKVCGFIELFFVATALIIPITIQPIIFIIKVLYGNRDVSFNGINPIRYRQTAPINPPAPTKSIFFIKIFQLALCESLNAE